MIRSATAAMLALGIGAFLAPAHGSRLNAGGRAAAPHHHHHARHIRVFSNGDSLGVGTAPYLPGDLRGFRVRQSASISRHAPGGVELLRHLPGKLPRVIVMQLGTNDDPRATDTFRSAVRQTIHMAGPKRCVVWVNIVRPPVAGASYAGYNSVLADENQRHRTFVVVKWTRIVRTRHLQLSSDGVHPTASGYQVRAKAIARQVRACIRAG
jgi:lysophospholipase L1-like esterase